MRLSTARRRSTALLAGALGAALALSGCASNTAEAESTPEATTSDEAFPVTIDTAYGEITLEEKPEKIVALGGTFVDLLGFVDEDVVAFANAQQTEEEFLSTSPWMEGRYEGAPDPSLITAEGTADVEAIAALDPDLIVTSIWTINEQIYEQLSQIAPTYSGIETDTQTSWQDNLASLAALTGHETSVVDEVEEELAADFEAAAARLPGLQGKSFIVPIYYDNQFWPTEYGNDPITALGLVPSDQQPHDGVTSSEVDTISQENIELLTEDVVFIGSSGSVAAEDRAELYASLQADPRVAELPASQNGTLIYFTDQAQWVAINGGNPTSYRWWLDQIVPQLEESALNQSAE